MLKAFKYTYILALMVSLFSVVPSFASEYKKESIIVESPWVRAKAPGAKVIGGYAHIINNGDKDEYLVGVHSPISKKIQLHEMKTVNNVMTMRALRKPILIKAHSDFTLKPGSYHIMFMNVKDPVVKDSKFPATFLFQGVGSVDVEFAVADVASKQAPNK